MRWIVATIVTRLRRWMPRIAAIMVIYLNFFVLIVVFLLFVVPPLAIEIHKAASSLPRLLSQLVPLINWVLPGEGEQIVAVIQPAVAQVTSGLSGSPLAVPSALDASVQVIFLSICWFIGAPQMRTFLLTLVPASRHEHFNGVVNEINRAMGGYVRGTAIDASIVGPILYVGLLLLGVKYALLLAVGWRGWTVLSTRLSQSPWPARCRCGSWCRRFSAGPTPLIEPSSLLSTSHIRREP